MATASPGSGISLRPLADESQHESPFIDPDGNLLVKPDIRNDNGSGYISRDFYPLLAHHELFHQRFASDCPAENGILERANRTMREAFWDQRRENRYQAEDTLSQVITHYNRERLHSALGYKTPRQAYGGQPERTHQARRLTMARASHDRNQIDPGIRQRTLPYETGDTVSPDLPTGVPLPAETNHFRPLCMF